VTLLFSGIFFLGTLSIFWSSNVDFYITKWLIWYCAAIVFFFGLKVEQSEKNLRIIFGCFVVAGTMVSLVGLAQYLFDFSWLMRTYGQPSSTFGNKNIAGQSIVLLAPFALFFLFSNKTSKTGIWVYSICLALMVSYAVIIASVAVWLSGGLSMLLITMMMIFDGSKRKKWLFWNRQKTFASLFSTLILLVLVNPTLIGVKPSFEGRGGMVSKISAELAGLDESSGGAIGFRQMLFEDAIEMIQENPVLGLGLGGFFEEYANGGGVNYLRMLGARQAHNDILELGAELGLIGLCLLIAIALCICRCLLVIFKHSEGASRLGSLLVTSAVAGSILNAQFSFPFQLVVPLVTVALLVSMLTRSAQQYLPSQVIKKLQVGAQFQKYSFLVSAFILIGIIFLNVQWLKEKNDISDSLGSGSQSSPYIVGSKVINPEIVMLLRQATQSSIFMERFQEGVNYLLPLVDIWPTAPVNAIFAVSLYEHLENVEENEKWAQVLVKSQPRDSFLGELFLVETYNMRRNSEGIKEIYNDLSSRTDEFIVGTALYMKTLVTLSVVLGDESQTPIHYQRFIERFPTTVKIETVMASYYYRLEQYGRSLPHMRKVLEMDPETVDAARFKKVLAEYSGPSLD